MAALTLGTLAAAAAVGGATGSVLAAKKAKAKRIAAGAGLVKPPDAPMDAKPNIPAVDAIADREGVETAIRYAAGRRKQKLGHSGTLLTGPRGLSGGGTTAGARPTLLGE